MIKELETFYKVNEAKSLEELADIILSLADNDGMIQGKTDKFNAERMAAHCLDFQLHNANVLTRMYGIRQQAMYLTYGK